MIPTFLTLALLLIPALLIVASIWHGTLLIWAPVGFATVLLVMWVDNFYSKRRVVLEFERQVEDKLSLGADNPVAILIRSRSGRAGQLTVKDDPPAEFITDQRIHTLTLQPYEQARFVYHTRPTQRGRYMFGNLHVRGLSLLGLSYWQRTYPVAQAIDVYPNLLEIRRYQHLAQTDRLQATGFRVLRQLGAGTEFESLREYTADDEFRSIEWNATARLHRPVSRQYEIERSQTMLIMVDSGRMMSAEIGDMARLDYAINAALMLCYVATQQDDTVGLIAFSGTVKRFVPPRKGLGQVGRVTESLYDLEAELVESNYTEAFGLLHGRARKRALVVCITDLVDVEASKRLLANLVALAPHHLPLLITLRDSNLERTAQQMPEEPFEAYQKAMASQVLADRETALAMLRQHGVLVLDAPPDKLTMAAVNRYLSLKTHGRL